MSHRITLLIADHILGKKVSLIDLDTNLTKTFACDAHFQFNNHELNPLKENSV